jgi:hypothetical protein
MKVKNKDIYSSDQAYLDRLAEEYTQIGFSIIKGTGKLTILTRKPPKVKPKTDKNKKPKREPKRAGARME